jgi:hypothetical protein
MRSVGVFGSRHHLREPHRCLPEFQFPDGVSAAAIVEAAYESIRAGAPVTPTTFYERNQP